MKRWTNGLPGATKRLGAKMALRGLAASQPGCARIPMMVRSKRCSTKRPDTLMQLSRSLILEIRLAPRGRVWHKADLSTANCPLTPPSIGPRARRSLKVTPLASDQASSYHSDVGPEQQEGGGPVSWPIQPRLAVFCTLDLKQAKVLLDVLAS